MRLPDFIIIGAAKSATTTIYNYLFDDPGIYMPAQKEPEFFARDEFYSRGEQWYSELFVEATDKQICGEASPIYSLHPFFPNSASRMHNLIPEARIIYIMRDPVQRSYSHYVQFVKNFQNCFLTAVVPMTFEEFLFDESDDVGNKCSPKLATFDSHYAYDPQLLITGGMYLNQINNYLKYYETAAMHLMLFEEFIENPLGELIRLYEFLGVGTENLLTNFSEIRDNVADVHFEELRKELLVQSFKSTALGRLAGNLLPVKLKGSLKKTLANSSHYRDKHAAIRPEKMLNETKAYLKNIYLKPTEELSVFLEKDMVEYWNLKD